MKNLYLPATNEIKSLFIALFVLFACSSVSTAATVTFTNSTPVTIPDNTYNGTIGSMGSSSVTVSGIPGGATITNIRVIPSVNHTWIGDLTFKLTTPDLSILGMMSRPGNAEAADDGVTVGFGSSDNLVSTSPITFSDGGAFDAENMGGVLGSANNICASDGECSFFPNPGSIATPPSSFTALYGETMNGTWTFSVGDGEGGDVGGIVAWTLEITYITGLTNDDCSTATITSITNGAPPTALSGTTVGATTSTDEANILGVGAVWEAVTLTGTCNNLTVDYCGTGAGIMTSAFRVYTDCPLTAITLGTIEFTTCPDGNATVVFSSLPAGTYYLPVVGDAGLNTPGIYVMNVSSVDCPLPPANDDCAGAITIGCSLAASVSGTSINSTVDAVYTDCGATGDNTTERGVWYKYPGDNTSVTITSCDPSGAGYDTRLTVYSGTCGALTCVTGNDDMSPACGTGNFRSEVTFNAYTGTDYYVFVHGYQFGTALSATGNFILNMTCSSLCAPIPANDECASAEVLTIGLTSTGSTLCSGSSPGLANPVCISQFVTPVDDWYTLTTGVGTGYNITLTDLSASNTGFSIYSGACGTLTELGLCFPTGTSAVSLTPSTTYYIRVFNNNIADEGDFSLLVESFTPVANDDCSGAVVTTLTNGAPATTLTGTTLGGTASIDEGNVFGIGAVWEAVTLTGSCNNLTVDYCGTDPANMANGFIVYTDCPLTTFTAGSFNTTACVDGNITINFFSLPAGTYYLPVIIDPVNNTLGAYTMNVSSVDCPAPPPNDDCANATITTLTNGAGATTLTGTTIGGTTSADELSVLGIGAVWEAVTLTGTCNNLTVNFCGTAPANMANGFIVYTDCPLTTFTAGTFNFTSCLDGNLTFNLFNLPAGTYYIPVIVDPASNTLGAYTMNVSSIDCPTNDDCAGAVTIGCSLSTSVPGTTIGSTVDAIYTDCGATGTNTTERGVWYKYPGDNTQVTITTCDPSGAGYDTRLTVYSGTCAALTCVTGNDDMSPVCGTGTFRSEVTFNAYTGTDYYVFVHGFQFGTGLSATGNFILNMTCSALCAPLPANDECAAAEVLTIGVTANGSTLCSASTPGLANPACISPFVTPVDDWYVVTTGPGSTYSVTLTELTAVNTGFALYTGACGSLVEVGSSCSTSGILSIALTPSTTYYIRVFNNSIADEGDFSLVVNTLIPLPNDDCSNAVVNTLINGAPATTLTGTTLGGTVSQIEADSLGIGAVWEAVTLTGTCNNLTVDYCGTDPANMANAFIVYTGCPISAATPGTFDVTTCPDGNVTINFFNLPAGTYYLPVIIDPDFNVLGAYTMNVSSIDCPPPPANDSCVNAILLACGGVTVTGSTLSATLDGPATSCTGGSVAPDVWYTYVGTGQDITVSLCGGGTTYDSKLDIYTGTCGSLTSVVCNDDACGGSASQVVIPSSILGTTYYIRIHGFQGDVGSYELTIFDNNPTITCPSNVSVDADPGLCTASGVNLGSPVTADDCGVSGVVNDAPLTFPLGVTTVTWTVTDNSSNTATCTQTVTVTDIEDPTITCPADVNGFTDAGSCDATGVSLGTPVIGDNCTGSTASNDAPSTFPLGATTVTWTVTDGSGNTATCTQTVTITDTEDPTITCPGDITVNTDPGSCDATNVSLGLATTGDNCGVASVTNDAASTTFPLGVTTVTWMVMDNSGNMAMCTQTVTVTDIEDPTITCPTDVNANADPGSCDATGVVLGTPVIGDNCTGASSSNDAPIAFPVGATTVTWTVTDGSGNTATCTQTVTVTDIEDPTITCPADVNGFTDAGSCDATGVSLGTPVIGDNCTGSTASNDAPSTFPLGATTVTWTVTDGSGNTATCTQTVTITDTEDPTITCPGDITVNTDPGSCEATNVSLGLATTGDNCGVASVTNDAVSTTYPLGVTTVTWMVMDNSGNMATCTQTVTVTDVEDPTITCSSDVNANADPGSCDATGVVLVIPVIGDNCTGASSSNDAPIAFPVGSTTVTWTVTDNSGNTATCTQTVTVTDIEDPTITCPADVNGFTDAGSCDATGVSLGTPVIGDNCTGSTASNDAPSTFPLGATTVTWTVTDGSGNTATCTQTVTITDTEDPTITCPGDITVNTDPGSCDATNVSLGLATTGDNCGVASVTNDAASTTFPLGVTTVTWMVMDNSGNMAMCTQTVTVTDIEDPTITCPTDVNANADPGSCDATGVVLGTPVIGDNCTGASASNDAPIAFPVGATTVTWTVTDGSGNTATCTQTVTVTDIEDPTITCPSDVNGFTDAGSCDATGVSLGTPVIGDNCTGSTASNDAPSTFPLGATTVTWTVTDGSGNTATCTQTVTITDTEDPTITCPAAVNVSADPGSCDATNVILGTATTGDNCGVASVTNDAVSTTFTAGVTTVTWTVTDNSGNTATCAQTVTVIDAIDPTITCPVAVSANTDAGSCVATGVVLGTPVISDNCTGATTSNDAPASFLIGSTTVTWTVTDGAGNTATCAQIVTVADNVDPTITCPPAVNVGPDPGSCDATGVTLGTPVTADNCAVSTVVNDAPSTFPAGITTVTWTVTDAGGNTATCTQTVTVTDAIDPTITCPAAVSVNTSPGVCTASGVALGTPVIADNCSGATSANDAPVSFAIGATTVTWTVTDAGGNTATCAQTVTVTDNQDPTIVCPAALSVPPDAGSTSATNVVLGTPVTSDNCTVATVTNNGPTTYPAGQTTVTWTVTDGSGNTATCTQVVTVTGIFNPALACPQDLVTDVNSNSCVAKNLNLGTPTATGFSSVPTITNDGPGIYQLGTTTVVWTATDLLGNTATCSQVVTVNTGIDTSVTVGITSLAANGSADFYQWINCTTQTNIPGQSGSTFTPTASGSYAVALTRFGCTRASGCFNFTFNSVGAAIPGSGFSVYPNPATDQLILAVSGTVGGNTHVQLFNVSGQVVRDIMLEELTGLYSLSLDGLASAVYQLRISTENGSWNTKVMKID